jgi:hypothetical protein
MAVAAVSPAKEEYVDADMLTGEKMRADTNSANGWPE